MLVILGVYRSIGLIGLWLGRIMLTQTPFKILLTLRGSIAAYGGLVLLTAVFSFSPDKSAREGVMAPVRPADAQLQARSNMLLIIVDTLRADHLGSYGFPGTISPELMRSLPIQFYLKRPSRRLRGHAPQSRRRLRP